MKLNQSDLDAYEIARINFYKAKDKITNRMDEILTLILKAFGYPRKQIYWYFHDAPEGEIGILDLGHEYIDWIIEDIKGGIIENRYEDYRDSMPRIFLTMTDKQILDYIEEENRRSDEKDAAEAAKKAKAKKKAEVDEEKLTASARSKLTVAERKALGIK